MTYLVLKNQGYVVKPKCNLITNVGLVGDHSSQQDQNHLVSLGTYIHKDDSKEICFDIAEDLWFYNANLKRYSFINRMFRKLRNLVLVNK